MYDGLRRLEGRDLGVREYPDRLGSWPAVVGFVAVVGVAENLTVFPREPRLTAALFAGYAAAMLLGAAAFGPTWLRRADAFAVLYRLLGRVAVLSRRRREDGSLVVSLRAPWAGCRRPVADGGAAAFVVVAVATVSADGLTGSPEHAAAVARLRPALGVLAGPAVFLGILALALALWTGTVGSVRAAAPSLGSFGAVARRFAPTVIPIAAAYELAHNYAYVAGAAGDLAALGTGAAVEPLGWLPLPWFWGSQVVLIVGGHVVAVVAAHAVATERATDRAAALRGHLPLVALMVAYTVVSLWIVSRPVVRSV